MFKLTINDLLPHQLKNTFSPKPKFNMDNTISITDTTQGPMKNPGININIHIEDFLYYSYVDIYQIGNRLYFIPTHQPSNFGYCLSINPTAQCMNTKIAAKSHYEMLKEFSGIIYESHKEIISGYLSYYIEMPI